MDSSIVLCDHDLLWDLKLKQELENENIFISHADSAEDISDIGNIFPFVTTDIIVCSVEEFYNFIEYKKEKKKENLPGSSKASIIAIADNYSADDELAVLNMGCFDYQLRTVPVKIIAQRIRNRIIDISRCKQVYYDKTSKNIYTQGHLVKLTKHEKALLGILLCNKGTPVPKEVILKNVWGENFNGSIRVIDTIIKQLRKKLSGYNIQIITHYGYGISIETW